MRIGLLLSTLLLMPVAPSLVQASDAEAMLLVQRAHVGLSQAADMVARSTGGRVLSAQTVQDGGRVLHRIKVLTRNGEVRIVQVDAATGRME